MLNTENALAPSLNERLDIEQIHFEFDDLISLAENNLNCISSQIEDSSTALQLTRVTTLLSAIKQKLEVFRLIDSKINK